MKVSEQIIQVLEYLCEKFGIVVDWSADSALPLIQKLCERYIRWEISTSVAWMIFGIALLTIGFMILPKVKSAMKRCNDDEETDVDELLIPFGSIASILSFIIGTIIICVQIFDIIRCCAFPELQVFEYVQTLIQQYTT